MAGINKVIVVGNIGRTPELNTLPSGDAVCNFSVATNEQWKNKDGEKQEHTEWFRCVAYGKTAEFIDKFFESGKAIGIDGKLRTREWEDKEGNKRQTTELIVREVSFVPGGGQSSEKGEKDENPYG